MIKKDDIKLYHFSTCPFCVRVRQYLLEEDIQIQQKDILLDDDAKKDLLAIGGKTQVPCLVVSGKALYESSDIIQWIESNKSQIK